MTGRPTDYGAEKLEKARHYLAHYEEYDDAIPSIAGLSLVLGIARSTVYDWASQPEKAEFSDILQEILSTQEKVLVNKGLKGEFNSNIVKLALGKHGYSDKQELTGPDGGALRTDNKWTVEFVNAAPEGKPKA